jgi:hypothetical protein
MKKTRIKKTYAIVPLKGDHSFDTFYVPNPP